MTKRAVIDGRSVPWHVHYGVTAEHWARMGAMSVFKPYHKAKDAAAQRGIEWHFNSVTWFAVWDASGKWPERGIGKGKYCMQRFQDKGAYAPGNVEIGTFSKNCADRQHWRFAAKIHHKPSRPALNAKLRETLEEAALLLRRLSEPASSYHAGPN